MIKTEIHKTRFTLEVLDKSYTQDQILNLMNAGLVMYDPVDNPEGFTPKEDWKKWYISSKGNKRLAILTYDAMTKIEFKYGWEGLTE